MWGFLIQALLSLLFLAVVVSLRAASIGLIHLLLTSGMTH
jgi:hypothetical protein